MNDPRRIKYTLMLAILVGSGLALLASTQNWFSLSLTPASRHVGAITVQGSAAAPALTALSLAGLALAGAFAIAGPIVRVVMAVLGVLVGACVMWSAFIAIGDPVNAAASAITTATGVSGSASITRLVAHIDVEIWPWFAVAGGIVFVLASLAVLVTSRRWPGTSRRFQPVRFEEAGDRATPSPEVADEAAESAAPKGRTAPKSEALNARDRAIDTWDELSRGEDPPGH